MDIAEVLTQMIQRACLYTPTTVTAATTVTTVTTATTTGFRAKMKSSSSKTAEIEVEDEKADGEVVMEPVVSSAASYSALVSTHFKIKLKYHK